MKKELSIVIKVSKVGISCNNRKVGSLSANSDKILITLVYPHPSQYTPPLILLRNIIHLVTEKKRSCKKADLVLVTGFQGRVSEGRLGKCV